MSSTPPAKRSRTDDNNTNTTTAAAANSTNNDDTNNNNSSINNNDVISTSKILQQITTLSNDYRIAKPFPHGVINNFCTDGLLGKFYFHIFLDTNSLKIAYQTFAILTSLACSLFIHTTSYITYNREDTNRIKT